MTDDSERRASRRALLVAGVSGAAALAGCPGRSESTGSPSDGAGTADGDGGDTPTESGSDGEDGDGAATDTAGTETPEGDIDPAEPGQAVLVDQVGYRPDDAKAAVVRADATAFAVVDAESGETVASGDLAEPTDDDASGDTVRHATFDGVTEPGTYRVTVGDGAVASHEFAIGAGVYGRTLAEICRRYTLRRANTRIDDPVTGLTYGPGHPQDREARMYFGDSFHEAGERIDARGGWYDAGDYGKYVTPGAVTVAQLLLAYERNPDTFAAGQLSLPESVSTAEREAGLPDLLAEAKFELEWLERMQRPDGAAYHKVAGESWPAMDTRPGEDAQPRYVFGLSTYGTAMVAGAMATAARVYRPFDDPFADRMLANARDAFAFLESNPDPMFRRDDGQNDGSGGYAKETDRTERFWAAAELLKTTGESRFSEYLEDELASQFEATPPAVSWANTLLLGHWAYYTADAADAERRAAVGDRIVADADRLVEHVRSEGYRVALSADQYYWASAKLAVAQGCKLLLANDVESRDAYVDAALDQIHYVLGRTPTTRSYVTGSGERAPENPHSRTVVSTGVNVPGNLVGGPNADGGDPALDELIATEDPPPAKCYLDETESYASNESAIDYAAPLALALAEITPASAVGVE